MGGVRVSVPWPVPGGKPPGPYHDTETLTPPILGPCRARSSVKAAYPRQDGGWPPRPRWLAIGPRPRPGDAHAHGSRNRPIGAPISARKSARRSYQAIWSARVKWALAGLGLGTT